MVSLDNFRVEQCCAAQPTQDRWLCRYLVSASTPRAIFSPQLVQQYGISPVGSLLVLPFVYPVLSESALARPAEAAEPCRQRHGLILDGHCEIPLYTCNPRGRHSLSCPILLVAHRRVVIDFVVAPWKSRQKHPIFAYPLLAAQSRKVLGILKKALGLAC